MELALSRDRTRTCERSLDRHHYVRGKTCQKRQLLHPSPTAIAITEGSIATFASLGGFPSTQWIDMSPLVLSRDGSRRIIRVGPPSVVHQHNLVPGIRDQAAELSRWWPPAVGRMPAGCAVDSKGAWAGVGALESRQPQNGVPRRVGTWSDSMRPTEASRIPSCPGRPVNHIPGVRAVRAELAEDLRRVGRVLAQPLRVPKSPSAAGGLSPGRRNPRVRMGGDGACLCGCKAGTSRTPGRTGTCPCLPSSCTWPLDH